MEKRKINGKDPIKGGIEPGDMKPEFQLQWEANERMKKEYKRTGEKRPI